jgi:hypothetical protein
VVALSGHQLPTDRRVVATPIVGVSIINHGLRSMVGWRACESCAQLEGQSLWNRFISLALCIWLGAVITEVLFEFAASYAASLRAAARFHYNVDKFGELPILFAVLLDRHDPDSWRLAIDASARR